MEGGDVNAVDDAEHKSVEEVPAIAVFGDGVCAESKDEEPENPLEILWDKADGCDGHHEAIE